MLQNLAQDLRHALRLLKNSPLFALVAVLSLAIGIGANTAIFSVLNGWLLRPLPVPAPGQIVVLAPIAENRRDALFSYAEFDNLRRESSDRFSSIFAFAFRIAGLSAAGDAHGFVMGAVSGNYFSGLGVQPAIGRLFAPGEGESAGEEIRVVLSHDYWKTYFAADPQIAGRRVALNGRPAVVIGVAQEGFKGTLFAFDLDGFATLNAIGHSSSFWSERLDRSVNVYARMKTGVSLRQAQASMNVIASRIADEHPESNRGVSIRVIPEHDARPVPLVASFVPAIVSLFLFLPALVLLLACLNIAGVIMARTQARSREMALRSSLGGGRLRLIQQLLTETMLIAALGCAAGVGIGVAALRITGSALHGLFTSASHYSLTMNTDMDWHVFGYSMAAAITAGLVVGLSPALRASRVDLNSIIRGAQDSTPHGGRFRRFLVTAQMAGSVVLLIVAALFIRSLSLAERADLGFDPHNLAVITLDAALIGYDEPHANALYSDLCDRLRELPGALSVASAHTVPMTFRSGSAPIYIPGQPPPIDRSVPFVYFNTVDADYLKTMRVPIVAGRDFTRADATAAIINEDMARRFWPGTDPIGRRFSITSANGPTLQVVGVARNGQYRLLSPDPQPFFYIPVSPAAPTGRSIIVRSAAAPETLIPAITAAIHQMKPDVPIVNVASMDGIVHGPAGLLLPRAAVILSGVLGLLGLGLATLGAYGVVSLGVTQRTRELGIRIAIGAQSSTIVKLVMGQSLRLTLIGVACGLAIAASTKSALAKLLIGVSGTDPGVYAFVCVALIAVAILACYLPARRATKINPVDALRSE